MSKHIRLATIYSNSKGEWWLQVARHYALGYIDTDWQVSAELGDVCLTPKLDIEDSIVRCVDELDAMSKMAQHYASELERIKNL